MLYSWPLFRGLISWSVLLMRFNFTFQKPFRWIFFFFSRGVSNSNDNGGYSEARAFVPSKFSGHLFQKHLVGVRKRSRFAFRYSLAWLEIIQRTHAYKVLISLLTSPPSPQPPDSKLWQQQSWSNIIVQFESSFWSNGECGSNIHSLVALILVSTISWGKHLAVLAAKLAINFCKANSY